MNMKTINKLVTVFFLFVVLCVNAQGGTPQNPNPPGGTGGSGTGSLASPVDMYVYVLGIAAVIMIAFFTKKYTAAKA